MLIEKLLPPPLGPPPSSCVERSCGPPPLQVVDDMRVLVMDCTICRTNRVHKRLLSEAEESGERIVLGNDDDDDSNACSC